MARQSTTRSDASALPSFTTPTGAVSAARDAALRGSRLPNQRSRRRTAEVQVPLGSLVTAPAAAPHAARCVECAGTFLTRLAMTLTDGSPVVFVSCHQCEAKAWFAADGTALPLDAVLSSATRD